MPLTLTSSPDCPGCSAGIGATHRDGCDVERCSECGLQRIGCGCDPVTRIPWNGYWPGDEECFEFGFFCKPSGAGFTRCGADETGAMPDLNRLYSETAWDAASGRRVIALKGP